MCIVHYENRLNHGLCIVVLHCIYNGLVNLNGFFLVSYGLSDQAGLSARAPSVSLDQIALLCQIQAYSWSLFNFNRSYATQNSRLMQNVQPLLQNISKQIMRLKSTNQFIKSLNVDSDIDDHHERED